MRTCAATAKITGKKCMRPAQHGNKFCLGHDPAKGDVRKKTSVLAAEARGQLPNGLARRVEISKLVDVSYSALYEWERRGILPKLTANNQAKYTRLARVVAKKSKARELELPPTTVRAARKAPLYPRKGKKKEAGSDFVDFAVTFRRVLGEVVREELRNLLAGDK